MITFDYAKPLYFGRRTLCLNIPLRPDFYNSVTSRKELKTIRKHLLNLIYTLDKSNIVDFGYHEKRLKYYVTLETSVRETILVCNVTMCKTVLTYHPYATYRDFDTYYTDVFGYATIEHSINRWWTYIPLIGRILK